MSVLMSKDKKELIVTCNCKCGQSFSICIDDDEDYDYYAFCLLHNVNIQSCKSQMDNVACPKGTKLHH